jgi:8-oxo-dGTP pyrophosphatase MutT (NUDIX family)
MQLFFKKIIIILNAMFRPLIRRLWWLWRRNRRGVQVIIQHGGEILLVKHSYGSDVWAFPGGGIKIEETPAEAAKREIMEELRLTLPDVHFVGDFAPLGPHSRGRIWVFTAYVTQQRISLSQSYELKDAQWFSLHHLPEQRSSLVKKCLEIAGLPL